MSKQETKVKGLFMIDNFLTKEEETQLIQDMEGDVDGESNFFLSLLCYDTLYLTSSSIIEIKRKNYRI